MQNSLCQLFVEKWADVSTPEKRKFQKCQNRGRRLNQGLQLMHRRTSTFGPGGAVTLLPERKLHSARKHVLYKGTQVAVKTKTLPILTSNARIIIPKLQLNPNFSNLRGKRKLVRKFRYLEKSGVTKFRRRRGK